MQKSSKLQLFSTKERFSKKEVITLLLLTSLYISLSISCDPLFFRQTTIFGITFSASAFIYTGLYALSDAIARNAGSSVAILVVLFDKISDGIFSYLTYFSSKLPLTHAGSIETHLTNSVNTLGRHLPLLYNNGLIISIIASCLEVFIFYNIYSRVKNFFLSTVIAITMTLLLHDIPSDYLTLKHLPNVWSIVLGNFVVCSLSGIAITLLISLLLKLNERF